MRIFPLAILALLAATALPLQHTGASYCVSDGEARAAPQCCDSRMYMQLGDDTTGYVYVDLRQGRESGVLWLYAESNGVGGMQRGGYSQAGVNQQVYVTPMGIPVVGGRTPGFEEEVHSRWDGCFDKLPGLMRDTNLI